MPGAISNTSPLVYLYRIGGIQYLPTLFDEVLTPQAVADELGAGRRLGYDVPDPINLAWLKIVNPIAMPSEWLALDLGAGELATMALALEHTNHVVLLDDKLARRTAEAAGLHVWGTLKVLLEAKQAGLVDRIAPLLDRLAISGMWISQEIRLRIFTLAGENEQAM